MDVRINKRKAKWSALLSQCKMWPKSWKFRLGGDTVFMRALGLTGNSNAAQTNGRASWILDCRTDIILMEHNYEKVLSDSDDHFGTNFSL